MWEKHARIEWEIKSLSVLFNQTILGISLGNMTAAEEIEMRLYPQYFLWAFQITDSKQQTRGEGTEGARRSKGVCGLTWKPEYVIQWLFPLLLPLANCSFHVSGFLVIFPIWQRRSSFMPFTCRQLPCSGDKQLTFITKKKKNLRLRPFAFGTLF